MGSQVSSDEMSVRAGQGSDEVLVSQAVWDYLAAAGRPWLLDFQHKQGMSAGIIRRGERGGCCAVRLQPVGGSRLSGVADVPVSSETRKAFIDLCRCARKEMSKQEGGSKRKRALLPCVGVLEPKGEGNLLQHQPLPPQPRRSQRQQQQQQKLRKAADEEACSMFHEVAHRKDCGMASHSEAEDHTSCSICMGDIVEKTTLEKCGHSFCRSCLDQAFKVKRACPVCRLVYGQLIGNQPANGTMIVERDPDLQLPGHEGYGCICIIYSFPPGLQALEHPNPGVRYPGTDRVAYLPDSPEGNRVLGLLRRAFEQRLTFTIGTSMTTGLQNVITWNDIHHKTSIWGGPRCFGYPDPTYLVRVTEELREKGITAD
ncbi:probable E3 ubiquitin-protein ligase DTX3 [Dunckerocampus dactyliophorus]|uniref:probable E3 ubiquitin-protein ligase DTX3 n=1 Tax=Dunckerocampus dactyliophorus TaxID=161453 RepID=UPI002404AA52|nr:probable E3 ubiquitin-protein ligase DTX3 [Dunckerocampus dactyliophorus]XP_054653714.1 probable E3 ubiquitin-protein ligase DTX3 [Dunckerocampus dactyliophorus]XP_054653723.1 probable E3 ubiquitin-protein ligase DTX3 [Dunckerocampus dactyliophorus]XP_054653733.1 probable E3 ubiquitin-protein ligase DTX3 [Dunckerocampus dactyliophorus]